MLAMHAAIQRGAGIGLAWDFMTGDAIAKGELVRVTVHRAIVQGLADRNIKSLDGGY
ncbi:hypothetical protein HHA02_10790 [Cobetia marina]|nr:hypothetical protein HHA02_10790 [Cobetia marina]